MTEIQDRNEVPDWLADERAAKWMEEHLPELKQSVSGPRLLYQSLAVAFFVGLAAHIGGYFLQLSASSQFLGLLADLLLALGWSLWTGVIVAIFVEVIPDAKRRQFKQAIDAYEALRHNQDTALRRKSATDKPYARRVKRKQGQKPKGNRDQGVG